jgi:hypothetical protein
LDRLRPLEEKFTLLFRLAFGISFKFTNWSFDDEKEYVEVTGTPSSPSTSSNMIVLEEEMDVDTKGKAKMHETSSHASLAKPPPG